jgi:Xaa-Pro aminopeptidase
MLRTYARPSAALILLCAVSLPTFALRATAGEPSAEQKPLFTRTFTTGEFQARRASVMQAIGDGVAILAGATEPAAYTKFQQGKQFFYLSGVEVPRAILLIDGRAKTSTLFLPARTPASDRSEGPLLAPGEEAVRLTGIEHVADRTEFDGVVKTLAAEGRSIYFPFRSESLGAAAPDRISNHERAVAADPWDGRASKDAVFREKLRAAAPKSEILNLDPFVDRLRWIKSAEEIKVMRETTRLSSLAILESMKSAKPGMYEYEIEAIADYIFKRHNAQGIGYYALVATGTNAFWPHYHAAQSRLEDGDLVLMDYAPDVSYYTTDVTRMFPANGTFSPRQREMYGIYLKLYQALMSSIRPGPAAESLADAHAKMTQIMETFTFTDPKIKEAATRFVAGYARPGRSFGHWLGMEAHDVAGANFDGVYRPGMMLTIEPALTIPDERIYIRLEDAILITANGFENLSGSLPMEIADIEKVMKEPGLADLWKVGK